MADETKIIISGSRCTCNHRCPTAEERNDGETCVHARGCALSSEPPSLLDQIHLARDAAKANGQYELAEWLTKHADEPCPAAIAQALGMTETELNCLGPLPHTGQCYEGRSRERVVDLLHKLDGSMPCSDETCRCNRYRRDFGWLEREAANGE